MKKVLIAFAVIALIVAAVSCKKCINCHYTYIYLGDSVTTSFPEECGSSSDISTFKEQKGSEANRYGVNLVCEDVK